MNKSGLKIDRRFTTAGADPFEGIEFLHRRSAIYNTDGSVIFEADDVEIPASWEQVAVDIVVSKFFRKTGVPQLDKDGKPLVNEDGSAVTGPETSVKQWAMRLANAWRLWGERGNYFATKKDAEAYRDEMAYMLITQMGSPNSPQHFNTGLFEAYGIVADPEGNWYVDPETGETKESAHRYERSAVNACFVNAISDELVGDGSIFDFFEREARLFKSGSGSGANMSTIRAKGELLSGGGTSSGVMSFMRVADRAAGAIKSGGTTRRAAKMVILDVDHPEIEDFIWCKVREEEKVAALVAAGFSSDWNGEAYDTVAFQNGNNSVRIMPGFMQAVLADEEWALTARKNGATLKTVPAKKLWGDIAMAAWMCADPGVQFDDLLNDWNTAANDSRLRTTNPCCFVGETLVETSAGRMSFEGLHSSSSLPEVLSYDVTDQRFVTRPALKVWVAGETSSLVEVTTRSGHTLRCTPEHRFLTATSEWVEAQALTTGTKLVSDGAVDLVEKVSVVTLQVPVPVYDMEVEGTHNFLVAQAGVPGSVVAHNSEYTHVDDTACNLASLNLVKFFDDATQTFDTDMFQHAVRLFTLTLEISVSMSHYPAEVVARNSFEHRTLGLGYANLGALLMRAGIPYDSPEGVAATGAVTALMHDTAYATSAEMATAVGPCIAYTRNEAPMARVLRNHARAAFGTRLPESDLGGFEDLTVEPVALDHSVLAKTAFASLSDVVVAAAKRMLEGIGRDGYRNMQATVLAPTGCVLPSTLVSSSRGLVQLGELGDTQGSQWQDLSGVSVLTDEGAKDATRFYSNGLSEVVRVETERGYSITGTPEHRVKVVSADGSWVWRRFGEIQPGELVPLAMDQMVGAPLQVNLPPLPEMHWNADFGVKVPRTMNAELAELLGYFMGDGSMHSKRIRFAVANEDIDLVNRITDLGKSLFNVSVDVEEGEGCVSVDLVSVPLTTWWDACGFARLSPHAAHSGKGYTPRIPSALRHTNDPVMYQAFLRGLFEADGSLNTEGVPSITSSSPSFLDQVRSMLLMLGFPTAHSTFTSGHGSEMGRLRVFGGKYTERFAREIGMLSDRKSGILDEMVEGRGTKKDNVPLSLELLDRVAPSTHWSKGGITELSALRQSILVARNRTGGMVPRHLVSQLAALTGDSEVEHLLGFFYDRVESAALAGSEFTYDLSVPENVTYVANGFVSHNTIGLQMDCDTTGVEPDFALVKFKKLAGGGYMKIVNRSVAPALRALGYPEDAIERILTHALGTQSLDGATAINRASLAAKGVAPLAIDRAEKQLIAVTELPMAFARYTIGDDALDLMGVPVEVYTSQDFNLLTHLGYSQNEILSSSDVICGHQTVEGAADLRPEHLAVFDTANYCGDGTRVIAWQGHVRALGAVAPHLSGSASKTINLPNSATVEEIQGAYELSYELGVKCAAVYRDGSKLSQVLSSQKQKAEEEKEAECAEQVLTAVTQQVLKEIRQGQSPSEYYHGITPPKFKMDSERLSRTWKFDIGGQEVFLTGGEYADGTLGEVWITLGNGKEGTLTSSILHAFAVSISMGLQYGVPLERMVDMYLFHSFAPNGVVSGGGGHLKMSSSILDAIFRILGYHYLGRDELVQVPSPRPRKAVLLPEGVSSLEDLVGEGSRPAPPQPSVPAAAEPVSPQAGMAGEPGRDSSGKMFASSGEMCRNCGGQMVKSGTCSRCLNCGETSGCS